MKHTLRTMTNKLNPFRNTLNNYTRPLNSRGLKYPPPICTRIQNLFQNLPISYTNISILPINLYNQTLPPCAHAELHTSNKPDLDQFAWNAQHQHLISKYPDYIKIYTDGSVSNSKSGCGVWSSNFTLKARLPDQTSIFTAELYAIFSAITFSSTSQAKCLILTDSLSSIQALQLPHKSNHHLVLKIASLISDSPPNKIVIQWIPSHMGIKGNELADSLAKESLNLNYITNTGYNLTDAIRISTNHLKQTFLKICNPCHHNNYISFTNSDKIPMHLTLPRPQQVTLTRLYLRVTKLTHLHIITKEPPKVCPHCSDIQASLYHIFIECPAYNQARQALISHCNSQNLNFNIDTILSAIVPPHLILDYIKNTVTSKLI